MSDSNRNDEKNTRERAYFIWQREGCPKDSAEKHWTRALREEQRRRDEDQMPDEEKIIDGRYDVNFPALLTKDVPGG